MDNSQYENYIKAGKIAANVREYGKGLIREGASILVICKKVEERIFELNAMPAFPAQISLNDVAAHYCPDSEDKVILKEQVVSLDVGVHIDGCIGDTAVTIDLSGKYSELIKASNKALDNAIEIVVPGVTLGDIGREIEETINSFSYNPVRNLSGHALSDYNVHTNPSIPNYDTKDRTQLSEGQIIAIEPFATTGSGRVIERGYPTVFSMKTSPRMRLGFVAEIVKTIESYNGLPFTTRWLTEKFSIPQVEFAITKLLQQDSLTAYPPLVEASNGIVSQSEHSIIVGEKIKILTE